MRVGIGLLLCFLCFLGTSSYSQLDRRGSLELCFSETIAETPTASLLQKQTHSLRKSVKVLDDPSDKHATDPDTAKKSSVKFCDTDRDCRLMRPGALTGEPISVLFGVYMKNFFGVDFIQGTWRADIVLSTRWHDPNVESLIQKGSSNVTIPTDEARQRMWLPDVVVSNQHTEEPFAISDSVVVTRTGEATRVQRLHIHVVSLFDARSFPFDTQLLKVRLASSVYMSNDFKLTPFENPGYQGVRDGVIEDHGDWKMLNFSTSTVEEKDGPLSKSRGEFVVAVHRVYTMFISTVLLPELILVWVPWTVFFFPLSPPFAMPKVASCMIPMLAYLSFMSQIASSLPPSAAWSWLLLYEECCLLLLLFAIVANITIEKTAHLLKKEELAEALRSETRKLYFILVNGSLFILVMLRHDKRLQTIAWSMRACFAGAVGIYVRQAFRRAGRTDEV